MVLQLLAGVLQTTFSQRGIQELGDTRGWTETPQQKLLRLSAGEAASARAIESAPGPSAAAGAVDAYNQAHRPKTLMEQHKDRLKVSPPGYKCLGLVPEGGCVVRVFVLTAGC